MGKGLNEVDNCTLIAHVESFPPFSHAYPRFGNLERQKRVLFFFNAPVGSDSIETFLRSRQKNRAVVVVKGIEGGKKTDIGKTAKCERERNKALTTNVAASIVFCLQLLI